MSRYFACMIASGLLGAFLVYVLSPWLMTLLTPAPNLSDTTWFALTLTAITVLIMPVRWWRVLPRSHGHFREDR